MSDIQRYTPGGAPSSRSDRQASRAIERQQLIKDIKVSRIMDKSDIARAGLEETAWLAGGAMTLVSKLSLLKKELELTNPDSSPDLNYLSQRFTFAAGTIIDDFARDLRRL